MNDPLLLTYSIKETPTSSQPPFLFDICSGLQPISIRDQMFRGYSIIHRALADGIIASGQSAHILVVGGGVAGLMTAMTAVQQQVPVVLIEKERLFSTQALSHRVVCATEYDWPAPHYRAGVYPSNYAMPFQLKTKLAQDLLIAWDSQLKLWQNLFPQQLDLRSSTKFLKYDVVGPAVRVHLDPPPSSPLPLFNVVISCAGFGRERTGLPEGSPRFKGFPFWGIDLIGKPNLGIEVSRNPKVIISGAGDGALQDFLRVACGRTAPEIYALIDEPIRRVIEAQIMPAEDRAFRQFVWGSRGGSDHTTHRQLHLHHQRVINDLFQESKIWRSVRRSIDQALASAGHRGQVSLAYSCDHFGNCYALNRFVALLISKYLDQQGKAPLLSGLRIVDIQGLGHTCLGDPFLCHGQDHDLTATDSTCLNVNIAGAPPTPLKQVPNGPFDVVIVRHGVEAVKPPLASTSAAQPMRQLIPYDV